MASVETDVPAPGCLILVLQLSASMKIDVPSHRGDCPKSGAITRLADEVVEDLVESHVAGFLPDSFEVSIVGYRTVAEGHPAVSLLPDEKSYPHFVAVSQLAKTEVSRRRGGDKLRKWTNNVLEEGEATPVAALANAHWIVQRWQADHPRSLPPIIVHCCDGTGLTGEYDLIVRSLAVLTDDKADSKCEQVRAPFLFHCVFSETYSGRMLPIQYCGNLAEPLEQLWKWSGILDAERPNCRGHVPRALTINEWPRKEIRQVWESLFAPPSPPQAESVEPLPLPEEPSTAEVLELPPDTELPVNAANVVASETKPENASLFTHRSFWLQKRGNDANQWEDSLAIDEIRGAAAICDGASAGIFCRQWAALLADRWVRDLPDLADPSAYRAWIDGCRAAWLNEINYKTIRISQRMRVDDVGAAATFLGLRIEQDAQTKEYRWHAVGVGDTCLFWIRGNNLLAAFPLTRGSQFDIAPLLMRSKRLPSPGLARASGDCQCGDLFVLATDAVAHWLFDEHDRGIADWARFETLDTAAWQPEMERLRDENRMVNDDCTLVTLRVGASIVPALSESQTNPAPEAPNLDPPSE